MDNNILIKGTAVSHGIIIGKALLVDHGRPDFTHYRLSKDEEVNDEENIDEGEEASDEGDADSEKRRRRPRRRRPGKRISAVTATLCKAPEMKTLDNDTVVEEVEGLKEIGTLSLMIEAKEARMFKIPVVRGEITVDGTTYEIYAKLARGRGPRGPGRGRNGEENNEDGDYDDE